MQLTTIPSIQILLSSSLLLLPSATAQSTFQTSTKRGLVFVDNKDHPSDNYQWAPPNADLTWYYNYQPNPSPIYSNVSQSDFEFVPMLWSPTDTFKDSITALVDRGVNITHVMAYNEPDGDHATGGSSLDPKVAAANYIAQIEPLRKLGIKVGAPGVTGSPRGHQWLEDFFNACSELGTNCTMDFIPIHWYGNFDGLASHLGTVSASYPNVSQWITEYALSDASLADSQAFFKISAEYMDRLDSVERYSYFGSFRSDISNVGVNAAMLTDKGVLSNIGAWYIGKPAQGNVPDPKKVLSNKSAAGRMDGNAWVVGAVVLIFGAWVL